MCFTLLSKETATQIFDRETVRIKVTDPLKCKLFDFGVVFVLRLEVKTRDSENKIKYSVSKLIFLSRLEMKDL